LLTSQIVRTEELATIIKKFPNFSCQKDCQNIDFLTTFQKLKNDFAPLKKVEEISY